LILKYKQKELLPEEFTAPIRIDDLERCLSQVPKLAQDPRKESLAEILDDSRYGGTEEERRKTYNGARNRALIANIFATAVCIWAIVFPRPYPALMMALWILPLVPIALVQSSKGLIRLFSLPLDAHPGVGTALFVPLMMVWGRANYDFDVLLSRNLVIGSFLFSAGLCYLIWSADSCVRKQPVTLIFVCLLGLAYGDGATIQINGLLENKPALLFPTAVKDKFIVRGRNPSYNLELPPWGPVTGSNAHSVSRRRYRAMQINAPVNIVLRTGLLDIQWYYLRFP